MNVKSVVQSSTQTLFTMLFAWNNNELLRHVLGLILVVTTGPLLYKHPFVRTPLFGYTSLIQTHKKTSHKSKLSVTFIIAAALQGDSWNHLTRMSACVCEHFSKVSNELFSTKKFLRGLFSIKFTCPGIFNIFDKNY